MKKLFTLLSFIFILTAANAQRNCVIQVTAVSPSGTINQGVPVDVTCKIKNLGPDSINPADTLIVCVQIGTSVYTNLATLYNTSLGLNEEKPFVAKNGIFITGTSGPVSICSFVFLQNRSAGTGVTTQNKTGCNTVNFVAWNTGVANPDAIIADGISIYPNPANSETKITYALSKASTVSISVKDLTGREVIQVSNESQSAGLYEKQVDVSSLKAGIYFVEYLVGDKVYTSKLIKN